MKKLLLGLSMILLLAGCGSDEDSKKDDSTLDGSSDAEYTVVFYDEYDNVLKEELVVEGDSATAPSEPSKEGYSFSGWTADFTNVQSDLDVYPIWTEQVVVQLYSLGIYVDGEIYNAVDIAEGSNFPLPTLTDDTRTFDGWYLDQEYTKPLNLANMPAVAINVYGRWIEASTVRTDLLGTSWYLGNSNGNLHNGGYGVYDLDRDLHYYVSGNGIYSFDPHTLTHSLLFLSTATPKSLMLNNDQLFYIDSSNGYLYVLDLTSNQVSLVLEMEILLVARYSGYIYVQYMEESYGSLYLQTHILDDETLELRTLKTNGAYHLNVMSSRLFYTSGVNIRLMATGLNGQTTLEYLEDYTIDEVQQLLVVDYDYDAHEFALIATAGSDNNFYVFKDGALNNVFTGDITSINHNGSVYVILVDGMIKTYDSNTDTLTNLISVDGSIDSVISINHWFYFIDSDTSTTYQYDPQTESVVLIP